MKRTGVTSSYIRSVGYDAGMRILEIEFTDGAINQYCAVSEATYTALMNSHSKGKYYDSHIRAVGYLYAQIRKLDNTHAPG